MPGIFLVPEPLGNSNLSGTTRSYQDVFFGLSGSQGFTPGLCGSGALAMRSGQLVLQNHVLAVARPNRRSFAVEEVI